MFKNLLEDLLNYIKTRTFVLGVICAVMIGILVHRLFDLQIINGEDYLNTFTYRIQKDTEIESPRGTIYDVNGVPLAYNKLSYSITLEDSTLLTDNQTKNTMIAKLVNFVESTGNTLIYDIPLQMDEEGNMSFSAGEGTVLRFKKDVYSSETLTDEQKNATAEDVYQYMRGKKFFNLDESYTDEEALKILSVRFDLWMKRYEKYLSVTVANDVNDQLVAAVEENADVLPGVSVKQDYTRVYADSKYFSNITGYIGSISEDELAEYKEQGNDSYSLNDQIGKAGAESYFESKLKGTKGSQKLYVNSLGSVLEVAEKTDPVPGKDVYLSIDAELQKTAYDKIEERIAGILLTYMSDKTTKTDSDVMIPIKEFYYALIDNNVISLDHLSASDADNQEKTFWNNYKNYESDISSSMEDKMGTALKDLNDEYKSYLMMAYNMLKDREILNTGNLDDNDETLSEWNAGNISFNDLIEYAITKDIVNISSLNLSSDYLNTEEIYNALLSYVKEELPLYEGFEKKAIYYMLQNDYISGADICLLLYSQNVLEKDDDYEKLLSGNMSAYNFMYTKIYNLEITPDMLALPPCSGSYVVTDVNTGKVKALVSYPGYDANQINNVKYYSSLINNESSPLYNRATQQTLAPGSTFKPISAIAGLEEGVIDEDTWITDNVTYTKVEPHANCWDSSGHGTINVEQAIEYSCNYFFYEVGYRLGSNNNTTELSDSKGLTLLAKYASMFGLDSVSGLELPETTPKISDESVVRSAIGQATHNYTAAELTRYVTAIANSGNLYQLSILDKITDSEGNVLEENQPKLTSKIELKQSTWDIVHRGMYKVCNESSYRSKMGNLEVTLAGKSGTAQVSETLPNHGLFIGYAPYEKPEVAATLIIPNGHGSSNVLDLYADLMCYYFNVPYNNSSDEEGESTTARTANIPAQDIQAD